MINFHKLEISGFMSFNKNTVLNLDGLGIVGVRGVNRDDSSKESNGAGKSCLFEALVWCLFDRTIRGVKYKDDVISKEGDGRCSVSVSFSVGSAYYIVKNSRSKPNSGGGREIKASGVKVGLEFIDEIFGGYEMFLATSFFHGSIPTFSQWSDTDKKKLINKLVNMEFLDVCKAYAGQHKEQAVMSYDSFESVLPHLQESRRLLKKQLVDVKALLSVQDVGKLQQERERLKKKLTSLKSRIKCVEKTILTLETKSVKAGRLFDSAYRELGEAQRDVAAAELGLQRWVDTAKRLKKQTGKSVCETCGTKIVYSKSNYSDESLRKEREVQVKELHGIFSKCERSLKDRATTRPHIETRLENRRDVLNTLTDTQIRLNNKLVSVKVRLSEHTKQRENINQQVKKITLQLRNSAEKIKSTEKKLKRQDELRQWYQFWTDGFGREGIPSLVLDSVLPQITDCVNEYLGKLTDGSTRVALTATASTKAGHETDRLSLEVENTAGGDDYTLNSSGERRVVDFCIMLALRKFILLRFPQYETSVLIMDEAMDSLDSEAGMRTVNILRSCEDLTTRTKCYIMSHREQIVSSLPETLTIEKTNRQSRIKKGDYNANRTS